MIDYEKQFSKPNYEIGAKTAALTSVFRVVYGWMAAGLVLSGLIAWYMATSGMALKVIQGNGMMICLIAELALVFVLSLALNKLPLAACYLMYIGYAALNGVTLSVIFFAYEMATIQTAFFITAGMFGGLALWGTFTKSDLSSIGSICGMALWGLIIAALVNIFLRSSGLDFICSFAGILIFTGLTMYDAQKIKMLAAASPTMDATAVQKIGIMGALQLYLDFINLFLHILRFLGRKK